MDVVKIEKAEIYRLQANDDLESSLSSFQVSKSLKVHLAKNCVSRFRINTPPKRTDVKCVAQMVFDEKVDFGVNYQVEQGIDCFIVHILNLTMSDIDANLHIFISS